MNIMGCLDTPSSGEYILRGERVSGAPPSRRALLRNREIGFVFQGFNLAPRLTALENVELPLMFRGVGREERRKLSEAALCAVGLADRMGHFPRALSGGQQQRVAIARAIASRPPVILADEPTGSLDRAAADECITLLEDLNRAGHTIVLITHDSAVAARARRVVRIEDGRII
jgi:putative ABC transport system ATP-binding protein